MMLKDPNPATMDLPKKNLRLSRYDFVTGPVEATTETTVSGGGTILMMPGAINNISVRGSSFTYANFDIPAPGGRMHRAKLWEGHLPVGSGHRMSVVWAERINKNGTGPKNQPVMAAMVNHSTGQSTNLRGPATLPSGTVMMAPDIAKGGRLPPLTVLVPFVIGAAIMVNTVATLGEDDGVPLLILGAAIAMSGQLYEIARARLAGRRYGKPGDDIMAAARAFGEAGG